MPFQHFIDGISKTGYGLEYSVSTVLIENGWTVINNKYYIDDVQGSAREIDIVAYRVTTENGIQVYTVIIISCKKSSDNSWALLTKPKNDKDPNIDWRPVTVWSNHEILNLILENYNWKNNYIDQFNEDGISILTPEKHIFAFQELNNKKGSPQNDKNIFNSVVSSMKSQDYEISSLNKRKDEKAIYFFNLVSVVDAPLIRINYENSNTEVEQVDADIYVGSYIVNKKEQTSRIHFINSNHFSTYIKRYNSLHCHNANQTKLIHESYYEDCIQDDLKLKLFSKVFELKTRIYFHISLRKIRSEERPALPDIIIAINWNVKRNSLSIVMSDVWRDEEINHFENDDRLNNRIREALQDIYRFEGPYHFDPDAPF